MGVITVFISLSFLVDTFFLKSHWVFYQSSIFYLLLLITISTYFLFLIYYIRFLIHMKSKEKVGSALLHIGILIFFIFGLLHTFDYFYHETKILMQEEKLYEIDDHYFVQWKKREEELAIIEKKDNEYKIVQKNPIQADKTINFQSLQLKQLDKDPFYHWKISTNEELLFSIFFNEEQVMIDQPNFEIIEFFPTYEIVDGIPVTLSSEIVKPAFLIYHHVTEIPIWVTEETIIGLDNAEVSIDPVESIGLLVVRNRLIPIFLLAAGIIVIGYMHILLMSRKKKQVKK